MEKRFRHSGRKPAKKLRTDEEEEAEVGIIESVSLKNFMCHDYLDFQFKPHVNFIIGKNGSGKSAVLTGIVVGLGGKAAVTGRASNFKTFIKNGKQIAEVAVRLRNFGSEAYKPEEYGCYITVERKLTADGSSSYKLKNDTGAVVSTKREELVHILDQFNIQVDNPVSVLNQETSRSFLNSKNAKDKYMFFLKATQLEQLLQDYTKTDETEKIIKDILKQKKETLPRLEEEVKDWQRRWKFHQSLENQREKLEHLRNEFAWAFVAEREKQLNEKLQLLQEQKSSTPKFSSKVKQCQEKIKKLNSNKEEIQCELQSIGEETSKIRKEFDNFKKELAKRKTILSEKELELRNTSNEIAPAKEEVDSLRKRIEELKIGGQQDYAVERQRREEEIALLEQERSSLLAEQQKLELSHKDLELSLGKISDDIDNLRQEERNNNHQILAVQRSIENLDRSKSNQLRRFGAYMPELLDQIELAHRQKKFTYKPRGPIGSLIRLHDAKWAVAVESCLKSLVFAFCCDNYNDERVLQHIMRAVITDGRKPSIIVSKFRDQPYDVRKFAVRSERYKSVLEMLDINDPVISNCLVDQRKIERILLIANNEEATDVMIDNVPHNCKEAFTLSGDQLYPAPTFRYYSNRNKGADYLQGNTEDKIKEKKEELSTLQHRQSELKSHITDANKTLRDKKTYYDTITSKLKVVRRKIFQLNANINELSIEEPKQTDVTVLEEELEAMQLQLQELEQLKAKRLEDRNKAKKAVIEVEKEYNDRDEKLTSCFSRCDPLKDTLGNIDSEIEQLKAHKQHYERKLKDHEKKVAELEKDYGATNALLEADVKKANQISPRIDTQRSSHDIEIEVNQIEKQLKLEEESHGSREEVAKKYNETRSKHEQIKNDVKMIEDFIQHLNIIMNERWKAYTCFRRQISMMVKYLFIIFLRQQNYVGKLEFDHKKKLLEIKVQPDPNVADLNEDTKALSGGERSFSTVCLILALWEAVESPFRILDEFDVFMDMVNRKISMDMMLHTAECKTKHQFIYLSPLEMTSVYASPRIHICRMLDPDRNQSQEVPKDSAKTRKMLQLTSGD